MICQPKNLNPDKIISSNQKIDGYIQSAMRNACCFNIPDLPQIDMGPTKNNLSRAEKIVNSMAYKFSVDHEVSCFKFPYYLKTIDDRISEDYDFQLSDLSFELENEEIDQNILNNEDINFDLLISKNKMLSSRNIKVPSSQSDGVIDLDTPSEKQFRGKEEMKDYTEKRQVKTEFFQIEREKGDNEFIKDGNGFDYSFIDQKYNFDMPLSRTIDLKKVDFSFQNF